MKKVNNREERIGFKIKDRRMELILPSFVKKEEYNQKEKTKEKLKYFKLLRKYNTYSKEIQEESLYNLGSGRKEKYMYSIFEAYYLLLLDYLELGPFIFTEIKTNKNRKGRVNWNRTINKGNLLISEDNLIYHNPYYTNNNIKYNHPLTILYGIHLLEIEEVTGFKINIHGQYRAIIENNKRTINRKGILYDYQDKMFSDRERKVIQLLNIINKNSRKLDRISTNRRLYYLENLNNIWEHTLKGVLEDEYYNFNKDFPRGAYNLSIEEKNYEKLGLRIIPDIIKEYKDQLYIIDAKNYLPHINGNLPGSGDINKQILYRYFLSKEFNQKNKYKLEDIKNIFLLPNELEGDTIREVGKHRITNINNDVGDIFLYQVDFNSLVDAYIDGDREIGKKILDSLD